jgi:uncharacterized protein YchJ
MVSEKERKEKVKKALIEKRLAKRREEKERSTADQMRRILIAYKRGPLVTCKLNPLPGRNEKCLCGSGMKFKNCCLDKLRPVIDEDFVFDDVSLAEELTKQIENVKNM